MTLFMFWMVGSNLSIWTIMITITFMINPIKQLFTVDQTFKQFEGKVNLFMPKLVYVAMVLLLLGMAIYKFSAMGMLPVQPIDWVYLLEPAHVKKVAFGIFQ